MAWRYRRSRRLPLGFRVNLSKSGLGWSWGFRGFRVGRDAKGRVTRTVSIPGTGLFNREVLRGSQRPGGPPKSASSTGERLLVLCAFVGFFILAAVYSEAPRLSVLLLIVLVVAIIWSAFRRSQSRAVVAVPPDSQFQRALTSKMPYPGPSVPDISELKGQVGLVLPVQTIIPKMLPLPEAPTTLDTEGATLAASIKGFVARLGIPLKEEMRKCRSAGKASSMLELDIERLIIRTGFDGLQLSAEAAQLYRALMSQLHPKTYSSLSTEAIAKVVSGCIRERLETYLPADMRPLSLRGLERYDASHGTGFAKEAAEMFLRIAECAAAENGTVPEHKRELLARLATSLAGQTANRGIPESESRLASKMGGNLIM
jgi:hypothetical protein